MKRLLITALSAAAIAVADLPATEPALPFRNPELGFETRLDDLMARLTLDEKVALMNYRSPAIERLGIPAYNWWNEGLHGVARTGEHVTSFPQAIGMAATFDSEGVRRAGEITSTEGRALFNEAMGAGGPVKQYYGLTYWTPNINIFRDPRWGRGQETYGEDPYLTSRLGAEMVRGLEGDDPFYLRSVACAKHFAVHSGPESSRHSFDARVSDYDLWDTYLPAFRHLVVNAKVNGVMCAYNRFEGQPCCGNSPLLSGILRRQWGFDGYVTSDCWAINDFAASHKTHDSDLAAVADAVRNGTDLECGNLYPLLADAVKHGLIAEKDLDVSVRRLLGILMRLGMFDPDGAPPYATTGREVIECDGHKAHALRMARESIVLLRNRRGILPLDSTRTRRILLVGPNIDRPLTQLGNYYGTPSKISTPYTALKERYGNRMVIDTITGTGAVSAHPGAPSLGEIASRARKADAIIFVGGINADLEGEQSDAGADGYGAFEGGDRTTIALPAVQTQLLRELKKTRRPLVLVNMSGSAMSFDWESRNIDAIVQAWYGGQAAGDAIADVLFGRYNPSGRMPVTSYRSDDDLPPFDDYSMASRTYRYFDGPVTYPFGHGLSYTTFGYDSIKVSAPVAATGTDISVSARVTNTGKRDGEEVVQLYVSHPQGSEVRVPLRSLKGFRRVSLGSGESATVTFTLTPEDLALVDSSGNLTEREGPVTVYVGGGQPGHSAGTSTVITLTGDRYRLY